MKITTENGLLFINGHLVGVQEADRLAREAGFHYAEAYAAHLAGEDRDERRGPTLTDQKIETIREVLCHIAGFPYRTKADMPALDYKAVELLTSELWDNLPSASRFTVYMHLYTLYGDEEIPEHVHRLAHAMTCRYRAVSELEGLQGATAVEEEETKEETD